MSQVMQGTTLASWDIQARQTHVKKVVTVMVVLAVIIALVIFGLVYPKCNGTQVHGFFRCNCAPGSALDKSSGLCKCLNNGTQLGGHCDEGLDDTRFVFSADLENNDWTYVK